MFVAKRNQINWYNTIMLVLRDKTENKISTKLLGFMRTSVVIGLLLLLTGGASEHQHSRNTGSERNCASSTCTKNGSSYSCIKCIYTCEGCGAAYLAEKETK
jgi:hypothetical protein